MCGPQGQFPGSPIYKIRYRRHSNNPKYDAFKLRYPDAREFLGKVIRDFGTRSQIFRQSCPRTKNILKNTDFKKGAKLFTCPWRQVIQLS